MIFSMFHAISCVINMIRSGFSSCDKIDLGRPCFLFAFLTDIVLCEDKDTTIDYIEYKQ